MNDEAPPLAPLTIPHTPPPSPTPPTSAGSASADAKNRVPRAFGLEIGDGIRSAIGVVRARGEHLRRWPPCDCGVSIVILPNGHREKCQTPSLLDHLRRVADAAEKDLEDLLARIEAAESHPTCQDAHPGLAVSGSVGYAYETAGGATTTKAGVFKGQSLRPGPDFY